MTRRWLWSVAMALHDVHTPLHSATSVFSWLLFRRQSAVSMSYEDDQEVFASSYLSSGQLSLKWLALRLGVQVRWYLTTCPNSARHFLLTMSVMTQRIRNSNRMKIVVKLFQQGTIIKPLLQNQTPHRRASNDGTFDSTALRHAGSASCEITIFCSCDDMASYRIWWSSYSSGDVKWSWQRNKQQKPTTEQYYHTWKHRQQNTTETQYALKLTYNIYKCTTRCSLNRSCCVNLEVKI